jgi:hypothetical protein
MRSSLLAGVALVTSIFSAGCENRYEALTAPPPGMIASLNDESKQIQLSKGVSLAFECFAGNTGNDACDRSASTNEPGIALVFPASLDSLTDKYSYRKGPQTRSAWVVVGVAPGTTSILAGGGSLGVTVVPADP